MYVRMSVYICMYVFMYSDVWYKDAFDFHSLFIPYNVCMCDYFECYKFLYVCLYVFR